MKKTRFKLLLQKATEACLDFSRTFLIDRLPNHVVYRVFPNQSYDDYPLNNDEYVFPEDTLDNLYGYIAMNADEVVDYLWRDEKVPEWIDVQVVAITETATMIALRCCGRFTSNEDRLYYNDVDRGPFGVKGPTVPPDYDPDKRGKIKLLNADETSARDLEPHEVPQLAQLSPSERGDELCRLAKRILGRRVATAASDVVVNTEMLRLAIQEEASETREAWLTYIYASRSKIFIPVLEGWLANPDEEGRLAVLPALQVNESRQANEILLRVITEDDSLKVRRGALRSLVRRGLQGQWEGCDLFSLVKKEDWTPGIKREFLTLWNQRKPTP